MSTVRKFGAVAAVAMTLMVAGCTSSGHKPEQADIDGGHDDSSTGRRQDDHDASFAVHDSTADSVEHDLAAYGHDSVRAGTGRARAFRAMHRWRASRDELR